MSTEPAFPDGPERDARWGLAVPIGRPAAAGGQAPALTPSGRARLDLHPGED